jgi:carbon storage regulator
MLVLSRKKDEGIVITVPPSDQPTRIRVLQAEIRGDKSRIGIAAPPEVAIHRDEVQQAIESEQLRVLAEKAA